MKFDSIPIILVNSNFAYFVVDTPKPDMYQIDNKVFAQNLLLTQAYCEMQLANTDKHVSEILRSINPEYNGKPMFHFLDGPYTYLEYYTDPLGESLYDQFLYLQLEYKRNLLAGVQKTTSVKGQILMVGIYEALPDGASEAETEGFIDGNDCPPIDTWFYIGQDDKWPILFAWIPEPFVETVDQGIAVNALEIFDWMENPKGVLSTGRFAIKRDVREMAPKKMSNVDHEIFAQNLLLTQAYCEMQLANKDKSPAEILRSFNPDYEGKPLYRFVQGQYSAPVYQSAQSSVYPFDHDKESFYTDLFELQLLNKRIMVTTLDVTSNYSGRILIADIDQSIPDGASEAESLGFIDEYDCPPVDTWFYIEQLAFTRRLYAWIPERFVELVNEGIDVNILNIFNWQDNPRHVDFSKEPRVENIDLEYQYHPHEKYMPDRRYIFPIVCAVLLLIMLLCWVKFHYYEG